MPLLWSFSPVQLSPSLAFFKVSTFLLTEARQDRCTANLCQQQSYFNKWHTECYWFGNGEIQQSSCSYRISPYSGRWQKMCTYKKYMNRTKTKIIIYFSLKRRSLSTLLFPQKKPWVCRFHSETFIPWTPVLFCRRGLFYTPACKWIGMW